MQMETDLSSSSTVSKKSEDLLQQKLGICTLDSERERQKERQRERERDL